MILINQKAIKLELNLILNEINEGKNFNIILRAPSGYGKTSFLLVCMYNLGWENCVMYYGQELNDEVLFFPKKRFIFIDEAHMIKNPEFLYQAMDSGKHCFFIATNEGGLVEPFINRCINLVFSPYSKEDIKEMIEVYLGNLKLNEEIVEKISEFSDNPRRIKRLCDRLQYIFKNFFIPKEVNDLENLLKKIDIDKEGFNSLEKRYLGFLKEMGRASLKTISSGTGIHSEMIISEIEPHLLYKKLIQITPRGRQYIGE